MVGQNKLRAGPAAAERFALALGVLVRVVAVERCPARQDRADFGDEIV
jgi:hypothetical protein